ncbi:hypothetical protein [Cupriavidus oxalaticus]|nr:hypothetical protein [Cupriavidus oxalaticus]
MASTKWAMPVCWPGSTMRVTGMSCGRSGAASSLSTPAVAAQTSRSFG